MRKTLSMAAAVLCLLLPPPAISATAPVSDATQECLDCHAAIHPGIVSGWQASRHAQTTPAAALAVAGLARKVSSTAVPQNLLETAVGCAECHTLRPDAHADTFDHNGHDVHVVVSPRDCATCHSQEADQYDRNIMAHAHGNLADNPLYAQHQQTIIGQLERRGATLADAPADAATRAEACFYCHGTQLKVSGSETRATDLGEMTFPRIDGWPNQGVGRINLDGSRGACSACHTRHTFSIAMARKPHTCKECHVGPDVPAFKVYSASKHGNIYDSLQADWDFKAVPWTVGRDFTAPTCAACHISLLVNTDGELIAQRTHQMSDRLSWRIFGLIYAHPHPRDPDTTKIRNRDGQPLPTDFAGGLAAEYLISSAEKARRAATMQAACLACHSSAWVAGHRERFENTIRTTNRSTLTATTIMTEIWSRGFAAKDNPFDEAVEQKWTDIWLFYANNTRFASAMAGGGDYGVFADGRYHLNGQIRQLADWLDLQLRLEQVPAKTP